MEVSGREKLCHSTMTMPSDIFIQPTSCLLGQKSKPGSRNQERSGLSRYVVGSMGRGVPFKTANTVMSGICGNAQHREVEWTVLRERKLGNDGKA